LFLAGLEHVATSVVMIFLGMRSAEFFRALDALCEHGPTFFTWPRTGVT
jgi:hypothetical protein